jgi:hypothetical protein
MFLKYFRVTLFVTPPCYLLMRLNKEAFLKVIFFFIGIISWPLTSFSTNNLIGSWRECSISGATSFERIFIFKSDNILEERIFVRKGKAKCIGPQIYLDIRRFYQIKIKSDNLTLSHKKDVFMVLDEEEAISLSKKRFCGINHWKVGEPNNCPEDEEEISEDEVNKFEIHGPTLLLTEPNEMKVYKFSKMK